MTKVKICGITTPEDGVMAAQAGELGVREEARGLTLPTAIWARWSR